MTEREERGGDGAGVEGRYHCGKMGAEERKERGQRGVMEKYCSRES